MWKWSVNVIVLFGKYLQTLSAVTPNMKRRSHSNSTTSVSNILGLKRFWIHLGFVYKKALKLPFILYYSNYHSFLYSYRLNFLLFTLEFSFLSIISHRPNKISYWNIYSPDSNFNGFRANFKLEHGTLLNKFETRRI